MRVRLTSILLVAAFAVGCGSDSTVSGVDLRVTDLRIASATSLKNGSAVSMTAIIKNHGDTAAPAGFTTTVEFFNDPACTEPVGVWSPVDAVHAESIGPGQSVAVAFTGVVARASAPPQLVYCRATLDIVDDYTLNNTFLRTVQVLPGGSSDPDDPDDPGTPTVGPDPGISSVTASPSTVYPGEALDVTVQIKNFGDTTYSGIINVSVEPLSSYVGAVPEQEDSFVLAPAASTSRLFSFRVDADFPPPGTVSFDATIVPAEIDENANNNDMQTNISVVRRPDPDLVISDLDVPSIGKLNVAVSVKFKVKNQGAGNIDGTLAWVVIGGELESLEDALENALEDATFTKAVAALNAGETSGEYAVSCDFSPLPEATYRLWVIANWGSFPDESGKRAESNYGNNADSRLILLHEAQ